MVPSEKTNDKFRVLILYYGPTDKVFALIFKQCIEKSMCYSEVFLNAKDDRCPDWEKKLTEDIKKSHLILFLMSQNMSESEAIKSFEAGAMKVLTGDNNEHVCIIILDEMPIGDIPELIANQNFMTLEYGVEGISEISGKYIDFVHNTGKHDLDFLEGEAFFECLDEMITTLTKSTSSLRSSLGTCGKHVIAITNLLYELKKDDKKGDEELFGNPTSVKSMQYHFIENRLENVQRDLTGLKNGVLPVYSDLGREFWREHIMGRTEESMWATNVAPTECSCGRRLSSELLIAQGKAIDGRKISMTRVFSYSLDEIINPNLSKSLLDLMTVQAMIGVNVFAIFEENFRAFEEKKISALLPDVESLSKELGIAADALNIELNKALRDILPGCDYMILDEKAVYLTEYNNGTVIKTELIETAIAVKAALAGKKTLVEKSQNIEVKLRLSERHICHSCFDLGNAYEEVKKGLSAITGEKYFFRGLIEAVGKVLENCGIQGDTKIKCTQEIVAKALVTVPEFAPCFKICKKDIDTIYRLIFDSGSLNNDQQPLPDIFADFGGKDQESVVKIFQSWPEFLSYLDSYQIKPEKSTGRQIEKRLADLLMKRPQASLGEKMFIFEKEVPLSDLIKGMVSSKPTIQENKPMSPEKPPLHEEKNANDSFSLEYLWKCVGLTTA